MTEPTTLFARAQDEISEAGGRYQRLSRPSVTGATPFPQQPRGPEWTKDPTGPEPALGFSVEDHPCTDEPHELLRSELRQPPHSPAEDPDRGAPDVSAAAPVGAIRRRF